MIYGTAWKEEKTAQFVALAIENGFKAIDTACQPKHYNEKLVGDGIAKAGISREDIFIQTKFTPIGGQDVNNMPYNANDDLAKQVNDSLKVSLSNLQTNYIDSLLIHSPISPIKDMLKVWQIFESFVDNGIIKQIGISNCYDIKLFEYIYSTSKIKPKVLQNRFYASSGYDKELRAFCNKNDISYQSFWSLTANPHILNSDIVHNLSDKYNKTKAQIFYRFLTQINITPLNGTTSEKHMKEDLAIFEFELDGEEIDKIDRLF